MYAPESPLTCIARTKKKIPPGETFGLKILLSPFRSRPPPLMPKACNTPLHCNCPQDLHDTNHLWCYIQRYHGHSSWQSSLEIAFHEDGFQY